MSYKLIGKQNLIKCNRLAVFFPDVYCSDCPVCEYQNRYSCKAWNRWNQCRPMTRYTDINKSGEQNETILFKTV